MRVLDAAGFNRLPAEQRHNITAWLIGHVLYNVTEIAEQPEQRLLVTCLRLNAHGRPHLDGEIVATTVSDVRADDFPWPTP